MGAWGSGSFKNDDAMDWVWTLEGDTDGSVLRATLTPVAETSPDDYLEAPDACCALAAAEVVAAGSGTPAIGLPEEVNRWV